MGSYLVVLRREGYRVVMRREGYRDTRYPVLITRNRAWKAEVRLYVDAEIGAEFIHVAARPFVMGGDDEAWNSLARSEPWVEDFFIAENPVTMGEYLEYLNDVARSEGMAAAKGRSPRTEADDPRTTCLTEDGGGGLRLPEVDAQGDQWDRGCPRLASRGTTRSPTALVQGSGPTRRVSRVDRGGNWGGTARNSRAAGRNWLEPSSVNVNVGFRLARSRFGPVTI